MDAGKFSVFHSFPGRICEHSLEGCFRAKEAANVMRLTAQDLQKQGIIERVFPEGEHYTREHMEPVTELLGAAMEQFLQQQSRQTDEERLKCRYARFRKF